MSRLSHRKPEPSWGVEPSWGAEPSWVLEPSWGAVLH